jgi:adenylate cyclase
MPVRRAPLAATLAAALAICASVSLTSRRAGAQRIAPLPLPCRVPGASPPRTLPARVPVSLAVSLFASDSTDASGELAGGLADAIANRIGTSVPRLFVIGRRAQRRLVVVDSTTARAMADSLGATYVLSGRVSEGLRGRLVSFTLYDGVTGRALMYRMLPHDSAHATLVERNVSTQLVRQVVGKPKPAEQQALDRAAVVSGQAYDWFIRANGARDVWAFSRAAGYLRQAVRVDASFAAAYAELALVDAEVLERGAAPTVAGELTAELRAASSHALQLDSSSSLSWRAAAQARLIEERPIAVWRRAFERAIALDPRDPAAIEEYGIALLRMGDRDAGRPLLERALNLEPGRAQPIAALAGLAVSDHRDANACRLLNEAIIGDVLYGPAWAQRAVVRARHGDLRDAWADAETATQLGEGYLGESAGAMVDMLARDTSRARDRLNNEWTQVKAVGAVGVLDGTAIARAMIAAGESTRALDVLELARPRGQLLVTALRDPVFDTIRGEKRFLALTAK